MKKNILPLTLSAVLTMTACAPSKETFREVIKTETPAHSPAQKATTLLPFWEQVAAGSMPNPALARLLVPYLSEQDHAKYRNLQFSDDPGLAHAVQSDRELARKLYMLRELPFRNDSMILKHSLSFQYNTHAFSAKDIADGFNLNLQAERQRKAFEDVLSVYTKRAATVAAEVAPAMVQQLGSEDQKKLAKLALSGDRAEAIEKMVEVLKGYDKVLSAYNFHDEDNTKLIVIGLVAGAIYDRLAQNPDVQAFIRTANNLVDLVRSVREMGALVQVVQDNRMKMYEDWNSSKSAMEGLVEDIRQIKHQIEFRPETRVEALRFMSDALTGNLQQNDGQGPLSEAQSINKNIETLVKSTASAAGRLDNILNATEKIAATLGVELDPSVKEAIEAARTVTSVVNLAQSVMGAYASGGLIGALGLVTGGPGSTLLGVAGGNALQAEMAADLKAIKKELAEVKRLQKQMIQMQLETMKMVRDIAVMVEVYHVEEMNELHSIKSLLAQQIETQRLNSHSEIIACEKMIQYGVHMNAHRSQPYKLGSLRTAEVTKHLLRSSLSQKGALAMFVRSSGEAMYETCQKSMTKAFGSSTGAENPVQIAANLRDDALSEFYVKSYKPLLNALESREFVSYPVYMAGLHVPAANFNALERKIQYAKSSWPSMDGRSYELQTLISTEGLERYVESLLVLHPILSYDKADWLAVTEDAGVLSQRYEISWNRSDYWLRNALLLTQSAITQEGIFAGESLLEGLNHKWSVVSVKTNCGGRLESEQLACAVRANAILTKNLLKFVISKRANAQVLRTSYAEALQSKNIRALELLLGADFVGKLKLQKDQVVMSWADVRGVYETKLPSATEVIAGEIEYTGHMKRLLILQDKIVDTLLELTPMAVSEGIHGQVRRKILQN